MPLVLMCGYPGSGKSRRTEELVTYLAENHPDVKVVIVGDKELKIDKNFVYSDSKNEKAIRGSLKSEADRHVTKDNVVILDSLNYIKGYRYELFCITKYTRTPHCVIHTEARKEQVLAWNRSREEADKYSDEIIEALIMRFEPPDSRSRWDSPLITVQVDDVLPGQQICDAIFHKRVPKPNMSTQNPPLRETDFLYEAGRKTQEIVSTILSAQKTMLLGDTVPVPGTTEKYVINHILTLSQMKRFRQQFLSYIKAGTTTTVEDIPKTFLMFLNKCIESC